MCIASGDFCRRRELRLRELTTSVLTLSTYERWFHCLEVYSISGVVCCCLFRDGLLNLSCTAKIESA